MVAAIAEIARALRLDMVAEFVTSKQSVELLRAMGISWAQGNYVGKPRSIDSYLQPAGAQPITDCSMVDTTLAASALTAALLPDFISKKPSAEQH
jgi:predicted signal transduction protein with EAL and GGDEF domain